jgi:hypothetical protein
VRPSQAEPRLPTARPIFALGHAGESQSRGAWISQLELTPPERQGRFLRDVPVEVEPRRPGERAYRLRALAQTGQGEAFEHQCLLGVLAAGMTEHEQSARVITWPQRLLASKGHPSRSARRASAKPLGVVHPL